MPAIAGTITESLDITDWRVTATKCKDGTLSGTSTTNGSSYSVTCLDNDICNVLLAPKIDYPWSAARAVSPGEFVVPSNPDGTPHLWKCTAVGAAGDSLTPPVVDTNASSVVLQLPFNGANNSVVFRDWSPSPKTITAAGDAKVSTTQSKFGGASGYFDGVGDYLTTPSNTDWLLSADFTVEMWIWPDTSWLSDAVLLSTNVTNGITIGLANASPFGVAAHNTAWLVQGANPAVNSWSHIAVVRSGNALAVYVNGVSLGSTTYTDAFAQGVLSIGALSNGTRPFKGYIDGIRITKGVARYTANFAVPTYPFVTESSDVYAQNDSLLLLLNGANASTTFTDNSPNPKTPTVNGNAQVSTAKSRFGAASAYFDGTGDYLSYASSSDFDNTGDMTYECWIYPTALPSSVNAIFGNHNAANDGKFLCYVYSTGKIGIGKVGSSELGSALGVITLNNWQHIAVVKSGTTATLFVNGASVAAGAASSCFATGADVFNIGYAHATNGNTWSGYIDEMRVTKGVARYTNNFTPPVWTLPTWGFNAALNGVDLYSNKVSSLLHFNGTNGATSTTDISLQPKTVTFSGNAALSNTKSRFGATSLALDGTGDYVTVPVSFNIRTEAFTLECHSYLTSVTSAAWFANNDLFYLELLGGNLYLGDGSTNAIAALAGHGVIANQWQHIALSFDGLTYRFFVDGVLRASSTTLLTDRTLTSLDIGGRSSQGLYSAGYTDDVRITKGIARYTSDFVPPSIEFRDPLSTAVTSDAYAALSLMLNCNGADNSTSFTDSSSTPKTVTVNGTAKLSIGQSMSGGSAALFNGSGSLSIAHGSWCTVGNPLSADGEGGSIGMWIYPTDYASPRGSLIGRWSGGNGWTLDLSNTGQLAVAHQGTLAGTTTATVPLNTFTYVGLRFYYAAGANKVDVIINNAVVSTFNITCTPGTNGYYIGMRSDGTLGFTGYIDLVAVAEGTNLFPTGFMPPADVYGPSGNVTGSVEPTWVTSGDTNDANGVVWTYVAPLVDPVALGPKKPS